MIFSGNRPASLITKAGIKEKNWIENGGEKYFLRGTRDKQKLRSIDGISSLFIMIYTISIIVPCCPTLYPKGIQNAILWLVCGHGRIQVLMNDDLYYSVAFLTFDI